MFLSKKVLASVTTLLVISGCASTPIAVNPTNQVQQQAAYSFSAKPGMAKVYFVGGKTGSGISLKVAMAGGAFFIIDGSRVGQIDKNDVMVMDVVPKQYNFSWQYPSADSKMNVLSKSLKAGDVVILQANWNTGGAGFGILGMAAAPAQYEISEVFDRSLVSGKRVVSPTTCSSSICQ